MKKPEGLHIQKVKEYFSEKSRGLTHGKSKRTIKIVWPVLHFIFYCSTTYKEYLFISECVNNACI